MCGFAYPLPSKSFLFQVSQDEASFINLPIQVKKRAIFAYRLLNEGHVKTAAQEFSEIYSENIDKKTQGHLSKFYGRALLLSQMKHEAIDVLTKSWELAADHEVGLWLGETLIELDRSPEAIEFLEDIVQLSTNSTTTRLLLARAYSDQGNLAKTLSYGRSALLLDPKNIQAYTVMGSALVSQEQIDQAISLYREAIKKNPDNSGLFHLELGRIYAREKRYDFAVSEFELSKRALPDRAEIYLETARALKNRGRKFHRSASINYYRAFELDSSLQDSYKELALMHYSDADYSEAARAFEFYLDRIDEDVEACVMAGISYERLGEFSEAQKCFLAAKKINQSPFHALHLGFISESLGEKDQALSYYEEVVESSLKTYFRFFASYRASTIYLEQDNYREAISMALKANKFHKNDNGVLINLGLAYESLEEHQKSYDVFNVLAQKDLIGIEKNLINQHWVYNSLLLGEKNQDQITRSQECFDSRGNIPEVQLVYGWALARHGDVKANSYLKSLLQKYPEAYLARLELLLSTQQYDKFNDELKVEISFENPYFSEIYRNLKKEHAKVVFNEH